MKHLLALLLCSTWLLGAAFNHHSSEYLAFVAVIVVFVDQVLSARIDRWNAPRPYAPDAVQPKPTAFAPVEDDLRLVLDFAPRSHDTCAACEACEDHASYGAEHCWDCGRPLIEKAANHAG